MNKRESAKTHSRAADEEEAGRRRHHILLSQSLCVALLTCHTPPSLTITPYPWLLGAASCFIFHIPQCPLESGAIKVPFYPSPLSPESVSSAGCLYSTYWRRTGVNKLSSARQIIPREGSSPLPPPRRLASPVPFRGSHPTCTELSGASGNHPIRPSPPTPG